MKNNTLIIIGLILIIIVCALFINASQSGTPTTQIPSDTTSTTKTTKTTVVTKTSTDNQPVPQTVSGYVVYYTDKGFSPAAIQVPQGQLVKFINNSSKALLIVADTNAPSELNESKSIGRGGVYTFNFTYAGVWAFHNADYPSDHGNIVVY